MTTLKSSIAVPTDSVLGDLKLPPHSIEAEQSVLGALLIENTAWERIGDLLDISDFYRQDHRLIYQQIIKLIDQNFPADIITVSEALDSSNELSTAGGLSYLGALVENTPSSANIRRYAEIVRERSIMRRLVEVG
ncbi:MAG: replicative DNA helicase, partial [Pseudomonadota bacterium]|nr:replicative DNA helicase [Pseudomonadota bacterium]